MRQLFRILHSLACYNPPGSISDFDLCKFWAAEAYRTLGDRLEDKEERKTTDTELRAIAIKHFALLEQQKMPTRAGRPFFCHFCGPSLDELSFQEVEKLENLKPTLEAFIAEFNEASKAAQLSIPMFSYMVEQTVKVNRTVYDFKKADWQLLQDSIAEKPWVEEDFHGKKVKHRKCSIGILS